MKRPQFMFHWEKLEVLVPAILIISLATVGGIIFYNNMKKAPVRYTPVVEEISIEDVGQSGEITPLPEKKPDLLQLGTWEYMPGTKKTNSGMEVQPIGFVLMNQNGTVSQKNPPINLVGTYIKDIKGDITIEAGIRLQKAQSATIQLYGQLPIIADEFRVERESIQFTLTSNQLVASIWNGKQQKPSFTQTIPVDVIDTNSLVVKRLSNNFVISFNDTEVFLNTSDPGIFAKGTMWFGLNAEGSTWLLESLEIEKAENGSFTIADASTLTTPQHNENGLQKRAAENRKEFTIGMAYAPTTLVSDPEYAGIALDSAMFGGMTTENELKMVNTQPQRGMYTFEKVDGLVHLAKQNGLSVHGHALVFGEANPLWFEQLPVKTPEDKKQIEIVMNDHITTVMQHFEDTIFSWDVVNEPLSDEDGETFRNHKWYQAMGKDYIVKAFITAHHANPKAKLFINEYGLEEDGERWQLFMKQMEWLKGELVKNNIPTNIIGVGFQSHVYEQADKINPEILRKHIRQLEALGVMAQISEMDVYASDQDRTQTDQYAGVFAVCFEEPNCKAWRGWILSDRYDVWKDDDGVIQYGEDGLFDKNMRPRPALLRMLEL